MEEEKSGYSCSMQDSRIGKQEVEAEWAVVTVAPNHS